MDGKINRRKLLQGSAALGAGVFLPSKGPLAGSETDTKELSFDRLEMSAESIAQAVRDTATSLAEGVRNMHGRNVNPRRSGFMYHPKLLQLYAEKLKLPQGLSDTEITARVRQHLLGRIKIFPVSPEEIAVLSREGSAAELKTQCAKMPIDDVGIFVFLSENRKFQRIYTVQKTGPNALQFLESYPASTSRGEPGIGDGSVTPLGSFMIPFDGIRLALLGEVTKVERPDITRYYFTQIPIDGKMLPFVKNFDRTGEDEIVTVVGDTLLVWSPEIEGRGIKVHDTTELDDIGSPASSGCIRTPSVRRIISLISENKRPTQISIYWAGIDEAKSRGFGGVFGGQPLKKKGK